MKTHNVVGGVPIIETDDWKCYMPNERDTYGWIRTEPSQNADRGIIGRLSNGKVVIIEHADNIDLVAGSTIVDKPVDKPKVAFAKATHPMISFKDPSSGAWTGATSLVVAVSFAVDTIEAADEASDESNDSEGSAVEDE